MILILLEKEKKKILDFGCGQGGNLNFFHKLGFDVYGVDISKKDINIAKKIIKSKKIISKLSIRSQIKI